MTTSDNPLVSASLAADGVEVTWKDGRKAHFHAIWLRRSPGFPDAQRPAGPQGRFPRDAVAIRPAQLQLTPAGHLSLEWSDGRRSEHDAEWLRQHDYDSTAVSQRRRPVVPWDAEAVSEHSEFEYSRLVEGEQARMPLFEHLLDHGVAMLHGVPTEANTITVVADWLGHVPANLYADDATQPTIGNVRVDPSVTVATNMCHFLGPHTDTCWRQTLSGLVLLHCLKAHPQGGRSIVVDGFSVARRLREQDEAAFDLLSRIPLNFGSKVDDRDDWRVFGRVISVAADGELEGIRYNGNSIGQLELPARLIEPAYRALETFESILYDKSLWWQPLLQPGDLLLVDNHRVLHGREAFEPGAGERHLQSCAVDRDDFHNRYRRIAKQLGDPAWDQRLTTGVI